MIEATDYHVTKSHCIKCGQQMDGATPLGGGRGPQPADVAVCAYCGHLQAYDDDLTLRELTLAEALQCFDDPQIVMAQQAVKFFNRSADEPR